MAEDVESADSNNLPENLEGMELIESMPDSIKMRIVRWYYQNVPYKEIASRLEQHKYKVNHVTIYRWCLKHLHTIDSGKRRVHEDKLEELQDTAVLKIIEKGLEALEGCSLPQIKTFKEFEQVSQAVARTITSKSQVERVKIETTRAVDALREQFKAAIQRELAQYPELVDKIHEAIAEASKKFTPLPE